MVSLWAYKVNTGMSEIDEVPERYRQQVRERLGIEE